MSCLSIQHYSMRPIPAETIGSTTFHMVVGVVLGVDSWRAGWDADATAKSTFHHDHAVLVFSPYSGHSMKPMIGNSGDYERLEFLYLARADAGLAPAVAPKP